MTQAPLTGRRIVVPESRELDLFTAMLERQGAEVVRCPLVLILPLQDATALDAWIGRLILGSLGAVVFYTGEGVTRIVGRAAELGRRDAAVSALAAARKITRGPKPVAALRKLGLNADIAADQPTTEGLAALIAGLSLEGQTVGVQLYPGNDGSTVGQALTARGAVPDFVLPYRYASDEEDEPVAKVIRRMAGGEVDLIAFTSTPQIKRLTQVAQCLGLVDELSRALEATRIAAVGPVTAESVIKAGGRVEIQPPSNFHLKPLVAEIVRMLG